MSEKEELLFGLKRWMYKATIYVGNYTDEEFLNDELVFDAVCYCLTVIDEITTNLLTKYKEVENEYKNVDFTFLKKLKNNCFVNDNINISLIYETCTKKFKEIISNL